MKMNLNDSVASKTYIHDREAKRRRQRMTDGAEANDLTLVDMNFVKQFASIIEGLCVMVDGAPNDQPCPITASVAEVRHFVHYMRQLDVEFRKAIDALDMKEREVTSLKTQLSEERRSSQGAHAKYLNALRKATAERKASVGKSE